MFSARAQGIAFSLAAAVVWAGAGSVAWLITEGGVSQSAVMGVRTVVGAAAIAIWRAACSRLGSLAVPRSQLRWYALLAFLAIPCNSMGFMSASTYLTVPQVMIIHFTFPLLTMIGDAVINREPPPLVKVFCGSLVVVGVYVGFVMGEGLGSVSPIGAAWGALSALGAAAQYTLARRMSRGGASDPTVQLFYVNVFGALFMAALLALSGEWRSLACVDLRLASFIAYQCLGVGLLANGAMFMALRRVSGSTVGLVGASEIVFALVAMTYILGTSPTATEICGSLIILAAVAGTILFGARRPQRSEGAS